MSTTHTPGPWRAKRTEYTAGNWDILAFVGREKPVCQTSCYDAEYNARLIAAAPDLLAACKAVMDWARTPGDHGGNPYLKEMVKLARAAIAKAEGRTE